MPEIEVQDAQLMQEIKREAEETGEDPEALAAKLLTEGLDARTTKRAEKRGPIKSHH